MKNNNINGHAAQPYTRITEIESESWAASSLVENQLAFVEVGDTLSIIAWELGVVLNCVHALSNSIGQPAST